MNECTEKYCCCKCKFNKQVNKHPWNEGNAKGPISEKIGYVCTVDTEAFIYSDREHGECEMFIPKNKL
jgi:hypothetical protein